MGNYGNWSKEAHYTFSRLASYLAIHQSSRKSAAVAERYGRLNIALVRSIARAILARELPPSYLLLGGALGNYRLYSYYSIVFVIMNNNNNSNNKIIASFASSRFCSPDNIHMLQAVTRFNAQVYPQESTTAEVVLACPPLQRALSKKLDNHAFQSLLSSSSQVNKARILSVSALMQVLSNPFYWSEFASGLS